MAFSGLNEAMRADAPTTATVIGFTILFFYVLYTFRRRNSASRLPPGPFGWPIIGNLHQLGRLPHRSLQNLAKKYGPIMYLRLGYFPTVVVSSSEMAKECLKAHDVAFASRPRSAAGKYLAYNYKDMALVPCGDYWRQVRKICVTELMSAKRLESFRCIREEEVSAMMRFIWEKSEQGRFAVDVSKAIASLSSAVIWRILAATKFSEDDHVVGNERELRDMVMEVAGAILEVNIGDFIPCLDCLDLQGIKRNMKKAHRFFDRVLQKIIDQHINAKRKQTSNVKDFVDVLLDMAESDPLNIQADNIKAIIFDVFIAGIETTAASIEWVMSEMVRNPHIAEKLQEEIESVVGKHRAVRESDLANMEYLQCVIKESLRLYPPGPLLLPHESTEACTLGSEGFIIPPKTRLIVNVWAIGRDPAVWEDPLAFKPERFLGKDIDIKGRDFEMLPFGAGRRGSPGALMAMGVMELTLAQLMHCFEWSVEGDPSKLDMSESFGTSLRRNENLLAIPALKVSNCF